ncbi:hypothetical protein BGX38DRAFT_1148806, partial [Terfezia claveryi]
MGKRTELEMVMLLMLTVARAGPATYSSFLRGSGAGVLGFLYSPADFKDRIEHLALLPCLQARSGLLAKHCPKIRVSRAASLSIKLSLASL